jgi:ketosteroid isomerase-like protein
MAAQPTADSGSEPSGDELLGMWREPFRACDVAGLTELYHPEAYLLGSTPTPHLGREAIARYFASSLAPGADVDFSGVESRLARPEVRLVLALAVFTAPGISLPRWLTQTWVDDGARWLVASHHAAPIADVRVSPAAGWWRPRR